MSSRNSFLCPTFSMPTTSVTPLQQPWPHSVSHSYYSAPALACFLCRPTTSITTATPPLLNHGFIVHLIHMIISYNTTRLSDCAASPLTYSWSFILFSHLLTQSVTQNASLPCIIKPHNLIWYSTTHSPTLSCTIPPCPTSFKLILPHLIQHHSPPWSCTVPPCILTKLHSPPSWDKGGDLSSGASLRWW